MHQLSAEKGQDMADGVTGIGGRGAWPCASCGVGWADHREELEGGQRRIILNRRWRLQLLVLEHGIAEVFCCCAVSVSRSLLDLRAG